MLIGIDPILDADLLYVLRAMGHGDVLAIVDANYPASTTANYTLRRGPITLNGVDAPRAIAAILSVMPLDTFVPDPAARMEVVGDPRTLPPVQQEVQTIVDRAFGKPLPLAGVERMAFYQQARGAFAVVATSERRALRLLSPEEGRAAGMSDRGLRCSRGLQTAVVVREPLAERGADHG